MTEADNRTYTMVRCSKLFQNKFGLRLAELHDDIDQVTEKFMHLYIDNLFDIDSVKFTNEIKKWENNRGVAYFISYPPSDVVEEFERVLKERSQLKTIVLRTMAYAYVNGLLDLSQYNIKVAPVRPYNPQRQVLVKKGSVAVKQNDKVPGHVGHFDYNRTFMSIKCNQEFRNKFAQAVKDNNHYQTSVMILLAEGYMQGLYDLKKLKCNGNIHDLTNSKCIIARPCKEFNKEWFGFLANEPVWEARIMRGLMYGYMTGQYKIPNGLAEKPAYKGKGIYVDTRKNKEIETQEIVEFNTQKAEDVMEFVFGI